jgi:hypothetical protein
VITLGMICPDIVFPNIISQETNHWEKDEAKVKSGISP